MIPGLVDGRGRTFFFASYEGQRRKSGAVDVAIVPSPAQRQGNFQGLAPIYDPDDRGTTRTQFAGNVIPQNRIAPAAQFFLRTSRCRTVRTTPGSATRSSSSTRISSRSRDHELTPRHKLFVRFSRHSNHEDRPSTFPALGATELWGPAFNLAGALTSNFGTSIVHELRVSRMRRVSVDGVLPGTGLRAAGAAA